MSTELIRHLKNNFPFEVLECFSDSGAYTADENTHDPVKLIKASIDRLKVDPVLETIPIVAIPFSDRFPNQATAYVGLHLSLNSPDPDDEPRCDLLDLWKKALQDANQTWEVAWAPATEGTDKQMWTRYPTLVLDLARKLDREPTKDEIVKCLQDILKANKIAGERVFALGTNGAAAILIHPHQADTILRRRSINSHSILPDKLQVDRVRQIEIEQPFELVVAGLSAYEQLDQLILGYLVEFVDEGGDLLAGWRSPEGHRDLLVFHMATWSAAKRVLNDHKIFRRHLQVFSMNDGVVPWKVTSTVERDVGVRLDATHAIVTDVQKSTGYLTEQVANLATTQQHTNLALVSMQREVTLTRLRAPLDAAESSLRLLVMLGGTEEEKNEAKKNSEILKAEKASIDAQINALQGSILALPPPPPRVPAPIPRTPPGLPITPTNSQPTQRAALSRSLSPSSPADPVNSSPRTPTQHDTDSAQGPKRRRISNEADGDITEEKEVNEIAQIEQDAPMDDAPAMAYSARCGLHCSWTDACCIPPGRPHRTPSHRSFEPGGVCRRRCRGAPLACRPPRPPHRLHACPVDCMRTPTALDLAGKSVSAEHGGFNGTLTSRAHRLRGMRPPAFAPGLRLNARAHTPTSSTSPTNHQHRLPITPVLVSRYPSPTIRPRLTSNAGACLPLNARLPPLVRTPRNSTHAVCTEPASPPAATRPRSNGQIGQCAPPAHADSACSTSTSDCALATPPSRPLDFI
ncbi:hypothetical protein B0H10DRAFT_2232158 [Mycena sp. CBHHK59/15]|nr:hypothetical protein B0H10DRAFT_2232158 [Mycena sp. CBHHK59/15]